MRMVRRIALGLALLLLTGCAAGAPAVPGAAQGVVQSAAASGTAVHESQLFAMDTYMTLRGYGDAAPAALAEGTTLIQALDAALSAADEGSEIAAVNRGHGPVEVSADTAALLARALELSKALDGALCLTLSPVLSAWGFVSGDYAVPDADTLKELLSRTGDRKVRLDGTTVETPDGVMLDLGAVAKGYAADRVTALLQERGVGAAIVNLGGSTIRAYGTKPDGSPWRIAIRDPRDEAAYAAFLTLSGGAVDTSGGYERYFEQDGETYWHILDPATGAPARTGLVSVTVLTGDAFTGDALSTALFVMGPEKAAAYWRETGGFEFICIDENDGFLVSEGAAESFSPTGRYADAPITVIRYED